MWVEVAAGILQNIILVSLTTIALILATMFYSMHRQGQTALSQPQISWPGQTVQFFMMASKANMAGSYSLACKQINDTSPNPNQSECLSNPLSRQHHPGQIHLMKTNYIPRQSPLVMIKRLSACIKLQPEDI